MIRLKKYRLLLLALFAAFTVTEAQTQARLGLDEIYRLAKQNYPLARQQELIAQSRDYNLQNAGKAYLPQVTVNGQASYQSTVTSLPIRLPGAEIPSISKDQYRIYGELTQILYDGGMTDIQKKLIAAGASAEQQKLESELYRLRERLNQLFFGVLLIDGQLAQTALLKKDLEATLAKTEAAVANGVALKTSAAVLKAEMLKVRQRVSELHATRKSHLQMLGQFTGLTLDSGVVLVTPPAPLSSETISRPELAVFEQQARINLLQREALDVRTRPKFSLFLQAGYGRPALNMLSNEFEPYYIGGIRLSWPLSGFYTIKKERALSGIAQRNTDLQKELFLFNIGLSLKQQDNEIMRSRELLLTDDEIIALRTEIRNTASAQLSNGTISASDYLREVNAEQQARETRLLHEIQLLMAHYNKQTIIGN